MVKKPYAQINCRLEPDKKKLLQHKLLEHSLTLQDIMTAAYILRDDPTYIQLVKEAKIEKNISF